MTDSYEREADVCRVLGCQISIPETLHRAERDRHVDATVDKISLALSQKEADLVVLPELSTIDYSRQSFERLGSLAETLDGRSVNSMQELARKHNTAIVFGMPRADSDGLYISQIIVDEAGELTGCYDKLHSCQYGASMEKEYYHHGNHVTVFDVAGFRFSPIICYDIRFPELCRHLTLKYKIDCILHCGAYFRDESFTSWHAFAITRAIENQNYLLSLNRAGQNYGQSIFCLPWMDDTTTAVKFADKAEDFRYLTLTRCAINSARQKYTFLVDRLDDYENLPTS